MKILSKLTDCIFHPLLLPIYGVLLFLVLTPLYSTGIYKKYLIVASFLLGTLMPLILYMMLISFRLLRTRSNRELQKMSILSYCLIWIVLQNKVFSTQTDSHLSWLVIFMLIGYGLLLIFSILNKHLSINMMGMGALTSFIIALGILYQNNYTLVISILVFLSGWLASSQLYLKKHTVLQIALGWFCGWAFQLIIFMYKLSFI